MIRDRNKEIVAITNCTLFCDILSHAKTREEREEIYENNYYNLQLVSYELENYRKLEEELGCPFKVLVKAVKQGKVWNGYTWLLCMKLTFVNDYWVLSNGVYSVLLENYAKDPRRCDSWWLKEDKSE